MITYRKQVITREMFDPLALVEMAEGKIEEWKEKNYLLVSKERKANFVRWILNDSEEFSYVYLRALIWLYKFEMDGLELEREHKYWQSFLPGKELKGGFTEGQIESAREYPVEDLIGSEVREFGGKKKARCPFHEEDTASFIVYADNSWHCFGCQAHGWNAIDFVMQRDKLGFVEAVKILI